LAIRWVPSDSWLRLPGYPNESQMSGINIDTKKYDMEFPERKRPKPPPSKMLEFLHEGVQNGNLSEKMGGGLLLMEQTLLTPSGESHAPITEPLAFSAVPVNGKNLDDEMKLSVIQHFKFFHSILLPASKTGSAELLSTNDILLYFMTKDGRLTLLCIVSVSTGFPDFESFKQKAIDKGKADVIANAKNGNWYGNRPNTVSYEAKRSRICSDCMTNILWHAGASYLMEHSQSLRSLHLQWQVA